MNDEFLQQRCKRLHRNVSTFCGTDEAIVNMLVRTIIDNREEIIEYLADDNDHEVWELEGVMSGDVSGKLYAASITHNWSKGAIDCETFIISLKKHPKNPNLFVITSAYPCI